jgi:hypothetical protein
MTSKRGSSNNRAKSQDVKAIEADVKALRKHQRDLLKKQGKSIREFRHEVATLKKLGIVSKKTDVRKVEPSRYRRGQLRKFIDVLVGTHVPVKAPKAVREKYSEKGIFRERGSFLLVPSEHRDMKARIKKGLVETSRPIGNKIMRSIILPYNATDMLDLANKMERDPTLASELDGADQYVFSLFGHTSKGGRHGRSQNIGFLNKAEMIKHIKVNYAHLFNGMSGRQAVQHFKLVVYSGGSNVPPDVPNVTKFYSAQGNGANPNISDNDWLRNRRRQTHAAGEKKRRSKLTDEQRREYKEKAKERAKRYRNKQKGKKDHEQ